MSDELATMQTEGVKKDADIITFYSYKGGCGRTMALANVAWILASSGKKVLAVDWDLESPGLHRYFHPFLDSSMVSTTPGVIDMISDYVWAAVGIKERAVDWYKQYARVGLHAVSLEWPHWPETGTLDFLSAGRQNRDYSSVVSTFDWDNFYERLGGGTFLDAMREEMKRLYDYVLIDSRTGLNDIADICTVHLADVLVACFTLNDQSIDGVASVTRQIETRYGDRGIRILPVPMRVEEAEKEKLDIGRALARSRLEGFPSGMSFAEAEAYWRSVEIPYKPYYAFEETLAVFGDEVGSPTTMLAAYERLTAVISNNEIRSMEPMNSSLRTTNLVKFVRRRPPPPTRVLVSYVPPDRMWADWIEAVLSRAGLQVQRVVVGDARLDPSNRDAVSGVGYRTIVILTDAYARASSRLADFDPFSDARTILAIKVADSPAPSGWERQTINLSGLGENEALVTLLRSLDLPRKSVAPAMRDVRYPGNLPRILNNLPSRNRFFVGRDSLLEDLRDKLAGGGQAVVLPQALQGLGGVGKSQVALEYAYRFMADYDLISWIPCDDFGQVARQLARLAPSLHVQPSDNVTDTARAVLDKLRSGEVFARWLLVFDNADDPSELEDVLVGGIGHVLITSFNQDWSRLASPIEVDVFSRAESVAQLRRAVAGLPEEHAHRVAAALGDLPLAIEQAGAWLRQTGMSVERYLGELERQAVRVLEDQATSFPESVVSTWSVSFERLTESSPAAAQLLRLLAFFSPGPISTALLYSDATLAALEPVDESLRDVMVLARLIQELNRFALVKVDQRSHSVHIHRLVQAVVRSRMTLEDQQHACRDVQAVLVAGRPSPSDPRSRLEVDHLDDRENWSRYELIWPHLRPAGAMESDNEAIRQLLIEWVRFQWKQGDYESSLRLGTELNERWLNQYGNDRQTLFLGFHIANVLRSLGQYADAYDWDRRVLDAQEGLLDSDHPATLMTAGGLAADLRALGRFGEALTRDVVTHSRLVALLGEDSPRTLAAANNLAVSLRLNGKCFEAIQLDQDTYRRRKDVLGPDHLYTLSSAANLALDLREVGEYLKSVDLLRSTYGAYCEVIGPQALDTLRAASSLAISLRRAGYLGEAMDITEKTLTVYVERYDGHSPDALACRLSLACDYAAHGDVVRAREFANSVVASYRARLGLNHPYSLGATSNLVSYLRRVGNYNEGHRLGQPTLSRLEEDLSSEHPFALSCAVNTANCLLDMGELANAEVLMRKTDALLIATLGEDHPERLICGANLAIGIYQIGRIEEAVAARDVILEKLETMLGRDHPITRTVLQWRCVDSELELQPI